MDTEDFLRVVKGRLDARLRLFGRKGCRVWQLHEEGGRRMRYGKMRVKFPNDNQSRYYYVHRLAYMINANVLEIANDVASEHVSHLCHIMLCCNPAHLSLEPQVVNNERQHCNAESRCVGHNWEGQAYPDCIVWYICSFLFQI